MFPINAKEFQYATSILLVFARNGLTNFNRRGCKKKKGSQSSVLFFPFILSFYRLSRNASRNFMVKSTRRTNKNGEFLCGRVNTFVEENIGPAAHRRVRESRDTYLSYRRIQRANPLPRGKTSEKEKRTRISVLPEFATRFFSSREYRHGKKKKGTG